MKSTLSVLVVTLLVTAVAEAQSVALATGAHVRVTSPRDDLKRHVTTVTEVRGDSIVVTGLAGSRTVAFSNVTALDVSTGRRSRFLMDAGIGLGVGALAGGLVGIASYEECTDCWFGPTSVVESAAWGGVFFGAVGLLAGAVVGAFHRADQWERRELPVKTAIRPSPSGGIVFSISRVF